MGTSGGTAASPAATLRVPRHALLAHKLTQLRRRDTPSAAFRRLLAEAGAILAAEALRDLPETVVAIETPVGRMEAAPALAGPEPCLVAVLRAGLALLDGAQRILPEAPVGHIGMVRDEATLRPGEYVVRLPPDLPQRGALVLDPMLATGGTAVAAVSRLKAAGARMIRLACVVAAPEGAARLAAAHPDVPVIAAALDERLDARGTIVPGLGDAGDRSFGT